MDLELETKIAGSAPGSETAGAVDEVMRAFEAFKDANDERLAEIEKRMSADAVTAEKVDRIGDALDRQKTRLDELALKARRPQIGGNGEAKADIAGEHKQAFNAYVRKGDASGLLAIEQKALSAGSDPDGGYLVPPEIETEIGRLLAGVSPISAIAGVRQVSSAVFKKPFAISDAATGWVAETAARPQTATPSLAELQFPAMELYAMPAATQSLLDDSAVNIDQWLAEEVQQAFAEQETDALFQATASTSPRAFSTTPRSSMRTGAGASSASSQPASTAPSRRAIPPIS